MEGANALNDEIVDPLSLESIGDRLGDEHSEHHGDHVVERPREFQDNDCERNGCSGDAS